MKDACFCVDIRPPDFKVVGFTCLLKANNFVPSFVAARMVRWVEASKHSADVRGTVGFSIRLGNNPVPMARRCLWLVIRDVFKQLVWGSSAHGGACRCWKGRTEVVKFSLELSTPGPSNYP